MPSAAWSEFKSEFIMGFSREEAKSLMCRKNSVKLEAGTGGVGTRGPHVPSLPAGQTLGHSSGVAGGREAGLAGVDSLVRYQMPWFLNLTL